MKNCYIHIPFCEKICSYCDFCKLFYNEKFVELYLDALGREITSIYRGEKLETIYIGGGTPSCLNISQLKKLFQILDKFNKKDNIEYTIECNFENTTEEKIKLFKEYGINRISFGLESVNKENLKFLDREINEKKIRDTISFCKSIGINNINVDLMYALPGESLEILKKDLDFIFSLDITHVSTYSLIIEEHTKLSIDGINNISEDLDFSMYELICREMKKHGYEHYEISNFSKDGYHSKHNLCYWNNSNYYGFGLGAASYIDNRRINNTRSITKYLKGMYLLDEEILDVKMTMEYEVILNLRKNDGISLDKFYDKYGIDLSDIYEYNLLIDDGLLKKEGNNLFIPEDKWYISNEIIVKLLEGEKYE